jgi:hypothetical protein
MLIGFIGAPSCGKSTTAFGLCYRLKQEGYAVEFFAEHARYQIMQCRTQGIQGNGGTEGQNIIYNKDSENALFYRNHADAICITDGSTINCHFYGYENLDFIAEAKKYDLLFYIPTLDVPMTGSDTNRVQNRQQILDMAQGWETTIRPLMPVLGNIVELRGYPEQTHIQMLDEVYNHVQGFLSIKKLAA